MNKKLCNLSAKNKNWYDVTEEYLRQSTDDKTFYNMTKQEEDERCDRLAYKALHGIVDEETIAADARAMKNLKWIMKLIDK